MKELFHGFYGVRIYLPLSGLSRKLRRFSKKVRRKEGGLLQQINLPQISWKQCTDRRVARIWAYKKANANVRISELGIINMIAAGLEDGSTYFEIGTFDGRTSLNLAFSSSQNSRIYTLDLKAEMETEYALARGERHMVEKKISGEIISSHRNSDSAVTDKIHQLYGDSASFDFSPFYDSCAFSFIDGSHAYEYVRSDTMNALRMAKKGGVIIWHDYGIWEGVTKALEEIEAEKKLGLKNISGTSLVYWKNG